MWAIALYLYFSIPRIIGDHSFQLKPIAQRMGITFYNGIHRLKYDSNVKFNNNFLCNNLEFIYDISCCERSLQKLFPRCSTSVDVTSGCVEVPDLLRQLTNTFRHQWWQSWNTSNNHFQVKVSLWLQKNPLAHHESTRNNDF